MNVRFLFIIWDLLHEQARFNPQWVSPPDSRPCRDAPVACNFPLALASVKPQMKAD
jgi:hypothetical protein